MIIAVYLLNILFNLSFTGSNLIHGIHISFGKAEITSTHVSGKINFYKDDFMKALKKLNYGNLDGLNKKEYDKLKYRYLNRFFTIQVNENNYLKLIITDNQEDDSSIWFSFRFTSEKHIYSITIVCTALFELYNDQMNMFVFSIENRERSKIFKKSNSKIKIIL